MNKTTKSAVITTLGVVLLVTIALLTGDGYKDGAGSWIPIGAWPASIVWFLGRYYGKLRIWNS